MGSSVIEANVIMDIQLAREILGCLSGNRTLFHYYKDRYAVDLLERHLARYEDQGRSIPVAHLRSCSLGRLLARPPIQPVLAQWGGGFAHLEHLGQLWARTDIETYVLTLGIWGESEHYPWAQVSRPGANLVLQLNFNGRHDRALARSGFTEDLAFVYREHPVSAVRNTMAWARIDLDLDRDEALIEEIQTDWLRYARYIRRSAMAAQQRGDTELSAYGELVAVKPALAYLDVELQRHERIWSEAMLSAALGFVFDELGIGTLYYHSFETGRKMKRISCSYPPESLYTRLPRQFCFEAVDTAPEFIANDRRIRRVLKKVRNPIWFRLSA